MSKLFSPAGSYQLSHRVVMAPLPRMRSKPGDIPSDLMVELLHTQRASKSKLIISETTPVSIRGLGYAGAHDTSGTRRRRRARATYDRRAHTSCVGRCQGTQLPARQSRTGQDQSGEGSRAGPSFAPASRAYFGRVEQIAEVVRTWEVRPLQCLS